MDRRDAGIQGDLDAKTGQTAVNGALLQRVGGPVRDKRRRGDQHHLAAVLRAKLGQNAAHVVVIVVEKHDAAVLFLTEKAETAPSLGSLVSLRVSTHRERIKDGEFSLEIRSQRDRRRPAGWKEREVRYGPDGLR